MKSADCLLEKTGRLLGWWIMRAGGGRNEEERRAYILCQETVETIARGSPASEDGNRSTYDDTFIVTRLPPSSNRV